VAVKDLTKIEICNMAIGHTGSRDFIDALDEGTQGADACALHYDTLRQKVLAAVDWPFAKQRQVLAATALTRSGWQYVYAVPADLLVVRKMWPAPTTPAISVQSVPWTRNPRSDQKIPYKIERDPPDPLGTGLGKIVLCDQPTPEMHYTADIDDASVYPPSFVDAFSLLLGSRIANVLSSDPKRARALKDDYDAAIKEAIAEAFNEELEDQTPASRYEAARRGGNTSDLSGTGMDGV
jgi:hypothetical protein